MDFEGIVNAQYGLGSEIKQFIENCKKAPIDRRTSSFFKNRIQRLQQLGQTFYENNLAILKFKNEQSGDEYFTKDYYNKINNLVVEFTKALENKACELADNTEASGGATNQEERAENQLDDQAIHLRKLIRNQKALLRALDRNIAEISMGQAEAHHQSYYTIKANILEKYMIDLQTTNTDIWAATVENEVDGYTLEVYYDMEARAEAALIQLQQHISNHSAPLQVPGPRSIEQSSTHIQLPRMTLPKFNGNYLEWVAFKDIFTEIVHSSPISDSQKMQFLTQSLTDEPKNLIKHLPSTGSNYAAAWNILTCRYDNKRLLVSTLLNKLFGQPSIRSDSPSTIKSLHDITKECLHGLQSQGLPVNHWDTIISHVVLRKLDQVTQTVFEQGIDDNKRLIRVEEILQFLERRFQALEVRSSTGTTKRTCAPALNKDEPCKICNKSNHFAFECAMFKTASIKQKWRYIKMHHLCANCLKPGHQSSVCKSQHCTKCTRRHNTLLHPEDEKLQEKKPNGSSLVATSVPQDQEENTDTESTSAVSLVANQSSQQDNIVLLGTARITLVGENGHPIQCKAILDSGSQVNLITGRLLKKLGVSTTISPLNLEGIGVKETAIQHRATIQIQSRINGFTARLDVHCIPKIVSEQPAYPIKAREWKIPKDLVLADPEFDKPGRIDCLLGAEIFYDLLTKGNIKLGANLPTLQNTVFGWIVAGSVGSTDVNRAICGVCTTVELEDMVAKFWKLEEVPEINNKLSEDDIKCESHFIENTSRAQDGRFMVKLPLKEHPSAIGDTRELAYFRLKHIENRLSADQDLKVQYIAFMKEYEALGHMTEIKPHEIRKPHYYIPHHYVMRPESTSTKLRVVFDASAHRATSLSLNDIMHAGPTVQSELFSILLRFRIYKYVLKTDVEKMYRQIWIHPDDRKLQLILWRESPMEKLKIYQLNTVTYGTRSAPYLATRCLKLLADENATQFPGAAQAIWNNFYVDDGLVGADSLKEAASIQEQLTCMLNSAGMKLKKWCANHQYLLKGIAVEDQEVILDFNAEEDRKTKTLGLTWLPKSDMFRIRTNAQTSQSATKRSVIANVARIYDPLGLIGPVIVTAKIFIQQLWQVKQDWDTLLPVNLQKQWDTLQKDLISLERIAIPRYLFGTEDYIRMELHAFADASEKAYGAAIYIRSILKNGTVKVSLVCSKSRIAPLKAQTIPRLELCAAVLASELLARIKRDLKYQDKATYYWTDSQIVLAWISNQAGSLPPFVSHRIAKIQQMSTINQWHHVSSKENPADILSRGLKPQDLANSHMWFYGPMFLYQNNQAWPLQADRLKEVTTITAISKQELRKATDSDWVYTIPSKNSIRHVQKTIAYMLRFINHSRLPKESRHKYVNLTPAELDAALRLIVHQIQIAEFNDVAKMLQKDKFLPRSHHLSSLTPFLDEEGIIRVGGRTSASSLPFDANHQMLLPYNDPLVILLMQNYHKDNYHIGAQSLLAQVRQRFWPLKGKTMTRSIVQRCVECSKAKPIFYTQVMGNLPDHRVQPARPFLNSGVDYCGPFMVHFKIRGKRPQKAYIAVFCCFATKAVHLELVSDLTTDAFIGALKRFIARRGHCQTLYCDNATNFVGAKNQLMEMEQVIYTKSAQESIRAICSTKGIDFRFIPPRSPHFGGLWEAAVKSAKHLLVKNVATASLTYEELETVIVEIEGILNSRPLIPLSADANDLAALTPGHFLIGDQLTSNVDVRAKSQERKLLERWKLVSQVKHDFWNRWSKEYLNQLQERRKWKGPIKTILPDTMVIIKEDNLPVAQWPLGRIVKVYKGDDGFVRVCDVKTQNGLFKRAVHRLAPLFREEQQGEREEIEKEPVRMDSLPVSIPLHRIKNKGHLNLEETPAKRSRGISSGLLVTILTLFFLPLALCNRIDITNFYNQPGIYFEQVSTVKLLAANWKIIVYFDLEPYHQQIDIINNGTSTLQRLCNQANNTDCTFLMKFFDHVIEEMRADLNLLAVKRVKRGAIDIIGNVANSLFGVLDSNYADHMSNTINELKSNDAYLQYLIKNQTSLIDSTINLIKNNQKEAQAKFTEIDNQINQLLHSKGSIDSIEVNQHILSLSVQMFMIVSNIQRIHSAIMDVLIDSHHNKLNPILLTPLQLEEEILKIKGQLSVQLELPIHQNNILEAYKLIKVSGIVAKNHVIFSIELPLTNSQEFQLLHLVPIVAAINDTLSAINLSTQYLAISAHRDQFIPMTQHQIDTCSLLNENELLCSNIQATYHVPTQPQIHKCEIDLINERTDPRCNLNRLPDTTLWYQLHHPNHWIFATLNTIKLNAVCGDDVIQFSLEFSGLMILDPDCTVKNEEITIQGRQQITTKLYTSITKFRPLTSWTKQYDHTNKSNTNAFEPSLDEWNTIQQQLKAIENSSFPTNQITYHHHGLAIGYVVLALMLLILIKCLWRRRGILNLNQPPTPMPRNLECSTTEC